MNWQVCRVPWTLWVAFRYILSQFQEALRVQVHVPIPQLASPLIDCFVMDLCGSKWLASRHCIMSWHGGQLWGGCLFYPCLARFSLCWWCKDVPQDMTGSFLYPAHLAFSEVWSSFLEVIRLDPVETGESASKERLSVMSVILSCHQLVHQTYDPWNTGPQAREVMVDSELAAVCWVMLWNGCGCHIGPWGPGSHGISGVDSDFPGLWICKVL